MEAVVGALGGEAGALAGEAADVLYHLLVLLAARDVPSPGSSTCSAQCGAATRPTGRTAARRPHRQAPHPHTRTERARCYGWNGACARVRRRDAHDRPFRRALLQLAAARVAACADELADPARRAGTPSTTRPRAMPAAGRANAQPPAPTRGPPPRPSPASISATAGAAGSFGVMAGDATPSNVMLWTLHGRRHSRCNSNAKAPRRARPRCHSAQTEERGDGRFAHVDAGGLFPGARYRYAFFVEEGGKPVARGPPARCAPPSRRTRFQGRSPGPRAPTEQRALPRARGRREAEGRLLPPRRRPRLRTQAPTP